MSRSNGPKRVQVMPNTPLRETVSEALKHEAHGTLKTYFLFLETESEEEGVMTFWSYSTKDWLKILGTLLRLASKINKYLDEYGEEHRRDWTG